MQIQVDDPMQAQVDDSYQNQSRSTDVSNAKTNANVILIFAKGQHQQTRDSQNPLSKTPISQRTKICKVRTLIRKYEPNTRSLKGSDTKRTIHDDEKKKQIN